ncbi:MAG: c-type cytochrome biogenesis protein CcmI [Burkholderiales bacterium]
MTAFLLLAVLLGVLTLALMTRPLWWGFVRNRRSEVSDQIDLLSRQLKQLKELHETGTLADEQYATNKTLVERKLISALSDEPVRHDRGSSDRHSAWLMLVLSSFVAATAGMGYYLIGSPASLDLGPGSAAVAPPGGSGAPAQGDDDPQGTAHALTTEQIGAMVDQLSERLKKQPGDGEGWFMLARSYVAMGRHADALPAFKQAARFRPDDPDVLVDYADALAVSNGRSLDGEPTRLVEQALKLAPGHVKALALAGTAAFDRKDYAAAVRYWDRAVQAEPAGSAFSLQIEGSLAEARQLASNGSPAAVDKAAEPWLAVGPAAVGSVSGKVVLAPALAAKAGPDDTVFIFARAVDGPRMPLAILRKRVSDLPVDFTLDDSMAMTPTATLSKYPRVQVGARISKSGDASARAGDFQGITPEIAVGAKGVRLEINEVVAK